MVTVWKNEIKTDLPRNQSTYSIPHFTLLNIVLPVSYEGYVLRALTTGCKNITPHRIDVCDFGNFTNGNGRNVIFVKTPNINFFAGAQMQLKRALRAEGLQCCAEGSNYPHLTIVKDLSDVSFANYWMKFGARTYQSAFVAKKLVLLRRPLGRFTKCTEFEPFPLLGTDSRQSLKPEVKQSLLFYAK